MMIYAAHPMTCYGTGHEARMLDALHTHFPAATVLNPSSMYVTTEEWLDDWPHLLCTIDALVVFPDRDGFVGLGVLQEASTARARGIPVATLDGEGSLRQYAGIETTGPYISASRVGRLLLHGPVLSPGQILQLDCMADPS